MGVPKEKPYTTSFIRRYRWWLLIVCLATGGVIGCWQLSVQSRFTRAQYDRIQLGMTPAEVSQSMGSPTSNEPLFNQHFMQFLQTDTIGWEFVDAESYDYSVVYEKADDWFDGSVHIAVYYRDGKASGKAMEIRQARRSKVGKWLNWLRGFLG
jgi:hypothetical protein